MIFFAQSGFEGNQPEHPNSQPYVLSLVSFLVLLPSLHRPHAQEWRPVEAESDGDGGQAAVPLPRGSKHWSVLHTQKCVGPVLWCCVWT